MAKQVINNGTVAGDGTGETLFDAFAKVNSNFTELYDADAALGGASALDVGTTAGTVAAGDHAHTGVYEPADATILKDADIGSTVQAYDADTAKLDVAQSWAAEQTFKERTDTVFTITDGAGFEIDPANGLIQKVTLGANRTPQATNLATGQEVHLMVDDGTAYTLTWTHSTFNSGAGPTWIKNGGSASAPTLATSGFTHIVLKNVAGVIYGVSAQP